MDYNKIPEILEKYWDGNTSLEEENLLKNYFNSTKVSDELKQHQLYFQYLNQEKKVSLSTTFDERLLKKLEAQEAPKIKRLNKWFIGSRVAAAILLLVSLYFLMQPFSSKTQQMVLDEETYETPEEAYQEVRQMLLMVSSKLNKGTDKATQGILKMQETSDILKIE